MSLPGKKMPQVFETGKEAQAKRDAELELAVDPAGLAGDGRVVFIGRVRSPWLTREDCPKNMRQARERGVSASVEIDAAYRAGLAGLERASHVVILTWLDRAPRNLIVQKPRHAPAASGTFALRSPARPNPIGLHVARLVSLDHGAGLLTLDAIDVLDGTPVIDVKPYYASADSVPEAVVRPAEG
jgi:tRNA-Thr(GGU) m(6)t(6)A37 methyltransferase TsaA